MFLPSEGCSAEYALLSGIWDSIALAANGLLLTRITPLANSAAMSLCLASLLTNYLRFGCLGRRQNPAFWRRETQRGLCPKRKQAARVKSLRDCPKQVRSAQMFAPIRPAIRGLQPRSVGYRVARSPAIDRKRTDVGFLSWSLSAGKDSRELVSMVLPP